MNNESAAAGSVVKFSVCLPTQTYNQLIEVLRSPFSIAPAGKLDRGVLSSWLRDQAVNTIAGKGKAEMLERFVVQKGLAEEFNTFYRANGDLGLEELL